MGVSLTLLAPIFPSCWFAFPSLNTRAFTLSYSILFGLVWLYSLEDILISHKEMGVDLREELGREEERREEKWMGQCVWDVLYVRIILFN